MRLVVTGGAGFLAFHIANELADKAQIHLLDIDEFHASDYPAGVTWAKCDVRDKAALERELKGADVIVHAAAGLPLWKPKDSSKSTSKARVMCWRPPRNWACRVWCISPRPPSMAFRRSIRCTRLTRWWASGRMA